MFSARSSSSSDAESRSRSPSSFPTPAFDIDFVRIVHKLMIQLRSAVHWASAGYSADVMDTLSKMPLASMLMQEWSGIADIVLAGTHHPRPDHPRPDDEVLESGSPGEANDVNVPFRAIWNAANEKLRQLRQLRQDLAAVKDTFSKMPFVPQEVHCKWCAIVDLVKFRPIRSGSQTQALRSLAPRVSGIQNYGARRARDSARRHYSDSNESACPWTPTPRTPEVSPRQQAIDEDIAPPTPTFIAIDRKFKQIRNDITDAKNAIWNALERGVLLASSVDDDYHDDFHAVLCMDLRGELDDALQAAMRETIGDAMVRTIRSRHGIFEMHE